jgi:hypothetical protein
MGEMVFFLGESSYITHFQSLHHRPQRVQKYKLEQGPAKGYRFQTEKLVAKLWAKQLNFMLVYCTRHPGKRKATLEISLYTLQSLDRLGTELLDALTAAVQSDITIGS